MGITRRLSSPRPSLPQIPCITSDAFAASQPPSNHWHLADANKSGSNNNNNSSSKFSRMLPDLVMKGPDETGNSNKYKAPFHAHLTGRTSSLGRAVQGKQEQQQQHQQGENLHKKIFAERQITYGGLAKHNANTQPHQEQSQNAAAATTTTTAVTSNPPDNNKRKRLSLTSGSFSHQFPSSNDGGDLEGLPDGGAGSPGGGGPAVSDIIGSFGLFQLLVLLFSGLREGLVGYDALIMSVILQPETRFLCADNLPHGYRLATQGLGLGGEPVGSPNATSQISSISEFNDLIRLENRYFDNNLSQLITTSQNDDSTGGGWNETAQCYRSADGGRTPLRSPVDGRPLACHSWIFPNQTAELGPSLVAEWSLVCQHHWLIAFVESAYFFGLVTGNLTWGYYADRFGRRPAYLLAHTISLVFGSLSIFMPSIYLFTLCRFLSAFGSVGYNIIYSIQVELIGVKHRSFSTILNHMGWGLGVICIPLVDRLFDDYRPIIAVAPLLSLVMYPWAFWLPESSRWLMANGRYKQAREELVRVARFNGKTITAKLEKRIWELEQKVRFDKLQQLASQSTENAKRSYRLIFTSPRLLSDTLTLAYLAFVGHLFYYLQTINFAYVKNLSTEANFITSGAGEWVSVLVGAILLRFCTRKTCMSLFLFVMAGSFAFQSLIESQLVPELDTVLIITTNNGLGTLSSLLLVFIALIVNQEVYPTIVRQTGTSITNTIGELGSTLAPLVIQLSRMAGAWESNLTYALLCAAGIIFAQFLTKTDDIELPDT